jgi:uridine kinase
MRMIQIELNGRPLKVPDTTTILALAASDNQNGSELKRPIGALVNHRLVPLDSDLHDGAKVQLIDADTEMGQEIYRRGCTLLLLESVRQLFPGVRLVVGQSLADGVYFDWIGEPALSRRHLDAVRERMKKLAAEDVGFEQERCGVPEAIRRFTALNLLDRVALLRTFWHETVRLVRLGQTLDLHHGPVPPSAGYLTRFGLSPYPPGFVLRFPTPSFSGSLDEPPLNTNKLFLIHRQTREWNHALGVENVGQLNELCLNGGVDELIRVSEGFHEKAIAEIADAIVNNRRRIRLVLIAGPSSSGKTTFLKRLSVQLKVSGLNPVGLSIDNYYRNREDTPRDENGEYDFEAIEAIDLELFNQHLVDLLEGREVRTPVFDFPSGRRQPLERSRPMRLGERDLLVVEGIHGLNERLTAQVPAASKYKVYVSALTQLCLDDANRIRTSDARLLRRIVRDRLYRGYSPAETLRLWPSVRRGEVRNIFPFQESADDMFNTALPYESAVLKVYAERFLLEVPQEHPAYGEVHRMMKFLSLFVGIFPDAVPQNSILREFIGGSTFKY